MRALSTAEELEKAKKLLHAVTVKQREAQDQVMRLYGAIWGEQLRENEALWEKLQAVKAQLCNGEACLGCCKKIRRVL